MKLRDVLCRTLSTEKGKILNFYDLLSRGIGNSVGLGILVVFGDLMRNVAGYAVLISIAVAGIAAVLAALCLSEFGVRFLKTETAYIYSYFYHGENVAFIFGWALILEYIAGAASIIKGLTTFADGLADNEISNFLNSTTPINWKYDFIYFDFISFNVVFLLVVPVAWKLTDYTIFKNIFTACNILLYLSVIVAGSFKAEPNNWNVTESENENANGNFAPFGVLGIIEGAAIVFYGYVGFETIPLTGHEITTPQKNLPFASLTSIIVVFFLYEGVAVILSLLCPFNEIIPRAALPLAFENVDWIAMKWIIVVGALFGFQTSLFGIIFPLPKLLNSMANDGLLFPFLNETYSKFKFGILLSSLIMAVLAGFLTFQSLVNLTVIGALFVSTIIAIDVVIIRYIPKEKANIFKNNFSNKRRPTIKEIVKQMFRFSSKLTTEVTENTVAANLFLLCLSSVAFGIVFGIFGNAILELRVEAIIPAVVFAVIIIFSIASIVAQPKSKIFSVFKVPFTPFTPCISIFINIFLMMFLGPVNLILFLIWMSLGIIPHFIWYGIKYYQGNVGNSSLYEINRFNRLKLNESVWKIKSEKMSFYLGFENNAFQDEKENSSTEVISVVDEIKEKIYNDEKKSLELKQAVIVQTPDMSEEPQNSDEQRKGINEIIEWECVAEIHTEDEFQQGSYEIEVVDDNYKFLSNVLGGPSRDSSSDQESPKSVKSLEISTTEKNEDKNKINDYSDKGEDDKKERQINDSSSFFGLNQDVIKQSVNKEDTTLNESEDKKPYKEKENEEKEVNEESMEIEKTQSSTADNEVEEVTKINKNNDECNNNNDSSDFNKMKNFKEQLNLFLKNQINENRTYGSKYNIKSRKNSISENSESDQKEREREIIKTLNKSEIKDKLDIILVKGPPKRASLRNSFNIKMQQSDNDNETKTAF